ncbi:MAG TPA: 30S ribosomal protein S7 [archaeon]|nr:30S ribosomal protein S7 [archaeon]
MDETITQEEMKKDTEEIKIEELKKKPKTAKKTTAKKAKTKEPKIMTEKKPRKEKKEGEKTTKTKKDKEKRDKSEKTDFSHIKIFGRWDSNISVENPGLRNYISLEARFLPRSAGIHRSRFHKSKMHITERLALHFFVTGHSGKKHRLTSGRFGGNFNNVMKIIEKAFSIIEEKEKKNPVEVLVRAIENAALREEIISYQMGSIMARESVITAPQRRVDRTLRFFAQGSYKKSFGKKKSVSECLADELIAASKNSSDSYGIKEKERIENEASGAR